MLLSAIQSSLRYAFRLLEEGRYEDALRILGTIDSEDETHQRDKAYLLGWYYIQKCRWNEAIAVLSPLLLCDEEAFRSFSSVLKEHQHETHHESLPIGKRERRALCLLHLGVAFVNLSHYEKASQHFSQCLLILQDERVHFSKIRHIQARYSLAMTYTMRGLYSAAIQHYELALELCSSDGSDEEYADIYYGLCYTCRRQGDLINAQLAGKHALELYENVNSSALKGRMHNQLGHVSALLANYSSAFQHYTKSLAIAVNDKCQTMIMDNKTALAEICLKLGQLNEVKQHCECAQKCIELVNSGYMCGMTWLVTAKVAVAEARRTDGKQKQQLLEEAVQYFTSAKTYLVLTDASDELTEMYVGCAQALEDLGRKHEALQWWYRGTETLAMARGPLLC